MNFIAMNVVCLLSLFPSKAFTIKLLFHIVILVFNGRYLRTAV